MLKPSIEDPRFWKLKHYLCLVKRSNTLPFGISTSLSDEQEEKRNEISFTRDEEFLKAFVRLEKKRRKKKKEKNGGSTEIVKMVRPFHCGCSLPSWSCVVIQQKLSRMIFR